MKRLVFRYISVFLLLVAVAGSGKGILYAQPSGMPAEDIHQEESFNAGEMILDHITDKHSWHICDWRGKAVEVHLPVILLYEGRLHCFSSARFENPTHTYGRFQLRKDAPHKGKIVALEAGEDGQLRRRGTLDGELHQVVVVTRPRTQLPIIVRKVDDRRFAALHGYLRRHTRRKLLDEYPAVTRRQQ